MKGLLRTLHPADEGAFRNLPKRPTGRKSRTVPAWLPLPIWPPL